MKKLASAALALLASLSLAASDTNRLVFRVQLGTDTGAATPFPFKHLPTFNAYPHLNLSLGGMAGTTINRSWGAFAGLVYKTVSMDADARVKNQKFQDGTHVQYFTGSAHARQRFILLELPLYAVYRFANEHDYLLCGIYHAWTMHGLFRVEPREGFVGDLPDTFAAVVNGDMQEMRFDEALDTRDVGLTVGYERRLLPRVHLGLRLSWGFKDIFKKDNSYFDYSMIHLRGSVVLAYDLARCLPRAGKR
ncbi:MAG: PorT family protein [Odoribacteraceae bacterium]|jgi:hypothetical protein|nr:PorT family protein [Odoribacteraceae bacterium]